MGPLPLLVGVDLPLVLAFGEPLTIVKEGLLVGSMLNEGLIILGGLVLELILGDGFLITPVILGDKALLPYYLKAYLLIQKHLLVVL